MTSYKLIILHKKISFPLSIFSVSVTKSAVSIAEEIINEKLHFCAV